MGKGKPRWGKERAPAPVGGPELEESDIEEADIEALARSKLGPGEFILGDEPVDEEAPPSKMVNGVEDTSKRGTCIGPLLVQKLEEIEYKVPEGAKRVPWVDTMCIDGKTCVPKGVSAKDGVKLESTFLGMAAEAAKEGYRRLRVMKIPCTRPDDFYAEMMRTDVQMYRVRQQAAEEDRRIKIVEARKKAQASKKFAKKAKTKKLEARAEERRNTLDQIADWRTKTKRDRDSKEDEDLEDILNRNAKRKAGEQDGKGKGKGKGKQKKSKKRQLADEKYGFGGKKKRQRQNDRGSTDDFSTSPWGKGKGKGGSKGKGKGKAQRKGGKRR